MSQLRATEDGRAGSRSVRSGWRVRAAVGIVSRIRSVQWLTVDTGAQHTGSRRGSIVTGSRRRWSCAIGSGSATRVRINRSGIRGCRRRVGRRRRGVRCCWLSVCIHCGSRSSIALIRLNRRGNHRRRVSLIHAGSTTVTIRNSTTGRHPAGRITAASGTTTRWCGRTATGLARIAAIRFATRILTAAPMLEDLAAAEDVKESGVGYGRRPANNCHHYERSEYLPHSVSPGVPGPVRFATVSRWLRSSAKLSPRTAKATPRRRVRRNLEAKSGENV